MSDYHFDNIRKARDEYLASIVAHAEHMGDTGFVVNAGTYAEMFKISEDVIIEALLLDWGIKDE